MSQIINEDLEFIISADIPWEDLKDKTVLITGGGGFLGSYLVKTLINLNKVKNLNINIVCISRGNINSQLRIKDCFDSKKFTFIQHDISQPLPDNLPFANIIIHCASQASPKYYGIDPVGTLLANSVGTMYLLNYAVKCKTEKFLFFSSGEIYGILNNPTKLVNENDYGYIDSMQVRSCYSESKKMGETMCVSWAHQYNLHTLVVRPFHTYGPGILLNDGRVFADFIADVVAKRNIVIKSNGLALRPFCYIADATIGFFTVLLKGEKAEAYNIGNPEAEISIKDLAIRISNLFPERKINVDFNILGEDNSYIKSPISRLCPSIEKVRNLGWSPSINIDIGFSKTIKSFL